MEMESQVKYENDNTHLNLKATELRLGLPGTDEPENTPSPRIKSAIKRTSSEVDDNVLDIVENGYKESFAPPSKTQVVGWPPVRSYRKNVLQQKKVDDDGTDRMYVKVSMDGAPFLRKIDLKVYNNYTELLKSLQNMFKCIIGVYSEREGYNGSEYVPTYEDKDGDWMLAGDVPWGMFITSCKRLRIMKASEAKGLACL